MERSINMRAPPTTPRDASVHALVQWIRTTWKCKRTRPAVYASPRVDYHWRTGDEFETRSTVCPRAELVYISPARVFGAENVNVAKRKVKRHGNWASIPVTWPDLPKRVDILDLATIAHTWDAILTWVARAVHFYVEIIQRQMSVCAHNVRKLKTFLMHLLDDIEHMPYDLYACVMTYASPECRHDVAGKLRAYPVRIPRSFVSGAAALEEAYARGIFARACPANTWVSWELAVAERVYTHAANAHAPTPIEDILVHISRMVMPKTIALLNMTTCRGTEVRTQRARLRARALARGMPGKLVNWLCSYYGDNMANLARGLQRAEDTRIVFRERQIVIMWTNRVQMNPCAWPYDWIDATHHLLVGFSPAATTSNGKQRRWMRFDKHFFYYITGQYTPEYHMLPGATTRTRVTIFSHVISMDPVATITWRHPAFGVRELRDEATLDRLITLAKGAEQALDAAPPHPPVPHLP